MADWIEKKGYATRLLADSGDLSTEGTEISLVRLRTGKYDHHHKKKTEFFYFLKGKGRLIIDGVEHEVKDGSEFLIKPGVRHNFINDSDEEAEAICVKTNNDPEDTYS